MPFVCLKTGEYLEVPSDRMITFLESNQNNILDRRSLRKRQILNNLSDCDRISESVPFADDTRQLSNTDTKT